MDGVVLVDSSVLIGLLREGRDPAVELAGRAPTTDLATCGMVRLEVLRGVVGVKQRRAVQGFLGVLRNVPTDNRVWEAATELAWSLDRRGITLPAQDILIACCARRIEATVLTWDKHFWDIPDLRVIDSLDALEG